MKSFIWYYGIWLTMSVIFGLIDKHIFKEPLDFNANRLIALTLVVCLGISDIRKDLNKWI